MTRRHAGPTAHLSAPGPRHAPTGVRADRVRSSSPPSFVLLPRGPLRDGPRSSRTAVSHAALRAAAPSPNGHRGVRHAPGPLPRAGPPTRSRTGRPGSPLPHRRRWCERLSRAPVTRPPLPRAPSHLCAPGTGTPAPGVLMRPCQRERGPVLLATERHVRRLPASWQGTPDTPSASLHLGGQVTQITHDAGATSACPHILSVFLSQNFRLSCPEASPHGDPGERCER